MQKTLNMPIDVFSRLASVPPDAAEQTVLRRVLSILQERGEDAVILLNVFVGAHEIDLVVASETATLVVEVKGYRQPIKGLINEQHWSTVATGEERPNVYNKINSASLTLKDAVRRMTGIDPGYAHAVALFAYGIPADSALPKSDHRVTIAGAEQLDLLLSTPIPRRGKRRLWHLDVMRQFARNNALAHIESDSFDGSPPRQDAPSNVQEVTCVEGFASTTEPERQNLGASLLRWRSRLGITSLALFAVSALFFAGHVFYSPKRGVNTSLVAVPDAGNAEPRSRHANLAETQRSRATQRGSEQSRHSQPHQQPTQHVRLPAQPSTPAEPSLSAPPCPPGIDRLGCVADAETLAKLRHY